MATKTTTVPTVPIEQFGKDHWSLLAYIETCCVDGSGELVHDRMRTNPDHNVDLGRSRGMCFVADGKLTSSDNWWKDEYSTRLKSFPWKSKSEKEKAKHRVSGHDDWDCLDDLEKTEFVRLISYVNGFVQITDAGLAMAAKIRAHKAKGGYFADFTP